MAKIFGVDFSHWQANVSFEKLVDNDVRFAIFKSGEIPTTSKNEFTDECYQRNISEARKHKVISGAYYYFHPSISASRQARHFDAVMQRDGKPDLPPVIDVEDTDKREPAQVADAMKAMIDALMERGYRRPIIYSRWGFLVNQAGEPDWLKDHYLWLAQYSNELVHKPADMRNVIMWQFTDRLKLPGVGVALDGNYWLKSEGELLALAQREEVIAEVVNEMQPILAPEPEITQPEIPPNEGEDEIIPVQTPIEIPDPEPETMVPAAPVNEEIQVFPEQPSPAIAEPEVEEVPTMPMMQPQGGMRNENTPLGLWEIITKMIRAIFGSFIGK